MKTGVLILNFGEPENPTPDEVIPFLERIFARNASLESEKGSGHARKLAEARAPDLIEEYKRIGGSPLSPQARKQARTVEGILRRRGLTVRCYSGMQFTEPSVAAVVAEAQAEGTEQLVALPVYPLCGRSTTVAALEDVRTAMTELSWDVPLREITGWHRHPAYQRLRADAILDYVKREGIDLHAADTKLVFSAHGTPLEYLDDGTAPEVETVIRDVDAARVIVDAVSFMHEQSETLGELDVELRETAEEVGLEFHRIPIPHGDAAFAALLADLVEDVLRPEPIMGELGLRRCLCRATPATFCLNAAD
jgi:ferrochelatase